MAWDDAAKDHFFKGPSWYQTLESTTLGDGDECRIHVIEKEGLNPGPAAMLLTRWNPEEPGYCAQRLLRGMTGPYSCEFGILTFGVRSDAEAAMHRIAVTQRVESNT